jgi:hypothetical protein
MNMTLKLFFATLVSSFFVSSSSIAQPINESWLGKWESTEPQMIFNNRTKREERGIAKMEITPSRFNGCVWSLKPLQTVGKEIDCHASYGDVVNLAQLRAGYGKSPGGRHLSSMSSEKPFRVVHIYTPAGSGDCGTFLVWDRDFVYEFFTQCPVEEDTKRVVKYTRAGDRPPTPTGGGAASAVDVESAFRAAGFKRVRGAWRKCEDANPGYQPGRIEQSRDLNNDGHPELFIVENSSSCFGMAGTGFSVVTRHQDGSWILLVDQAIGIPGVLKIRSPSGWLDILVGGPGFCFPVLRHNGRVYEEHRMESEGKSCQR